MEPRVAPPGCHDQAHRRRANDPARELRTVQPGRADRRARARSTRVPPPHDDGVRCGDRRLHAASSRWSIPGSTCSSIPRCARRARTSTPSASIASSAAGWRWRSPTSARTARLHRLDGCRRPVSRGDAHAARRPQPAGLRARQRHRRSALSVDEPGRYSLTYNGLVMAVEKRRVPRLAGVWLVHVLEGVRAAGVQRRRPPQARRSAPSRRPPFRATSAAIPTTSPTRVAGCRTIARTCSG